jgi:4-azaleucine resistance transporter AzlC
LRCVIQELRAFIFQERHTENMKGRGNIMKAGTSFKRGLKAGIPIAVGYLPIAIAFGVLAKTLGIPSIIAMLMSLIVFAGASQFVGIKLMSLGALPIEIVLATFILNLRHFLMTSFIAQNLEKDTSKKLIPQLAFGITDETFAVASIEGKGEISPQFMLGLNLMAFSFWNIGTLAGLLMSTWIPEYIISGMGIALYAMFIGLVVPSMRTASPILIVALTAMAVNSAFYFVPALSFVSPSWAIIISTIFAALLGSFIDGRREMAND